MENIFWHNTEINRDDRSRLKGHRNCAIWLTGLSASGKSTIAVELEKKLFKRKIHAYILDGDNIRHGLNRNLGFSQKDRTENIRRVGEVAKLLVDAGLVTISAFISPFQKDRDMVRALFAPSDFVEVYVKCKIEECEKRDPKGLYKRAREGTLSEFTGISSPYEEPIYPDITVETDRMSPDEAVDHILDSLEKMSLITKYQ